MTVWIDTAIGVKGGDELPRFTELYVFESFCQNFGNICNNEMYQKWFLGNTDLFIMYKYVS